MHRSLAILAIVCMAVVFTAGVSYAQSSHDTLPLAPTDPRLTGLPLPPTPRGFTYQPEIRSPRLYDPRSAYYYWQAPSDPYPLFTDPQRYAWYRPEFDPSAALLR